MFGQASTVAPQRSKDEGANLPSNPKGSSPYTPTLVNSPSCAPTVIDSPVTAPTAMRSPFTPTTVNTPTQSARGNAPSCPPTLRYSHTPSTRSRDAMGSSGTQSKRPMDPEPRHSPSQVRPRTASSSPCNEPLYTYRTKSSHGEVGRQSYRYEEKNKNRG